MRILIVDDDGQAAEALEGLVRGWGWAPSVAQDGESALAILASEWFELVLLDLTLCGMDGFEVARRVKNEPEAFGEPLLVALTSHTTAKMKALALSVGMDSYITKPLESAPRLYEALRDLVPRV